VSGFLLDTNVISETTKDRPNANVRDWLTTVAEEDTYLSVITLGELRRGVASLTSSVKRTRLESWLQDVMLRFRGRLLPVDEAVAERWGVMVADAEAAGRTLPGSDSLIAATALEHRMVFVTRDAGELAISGVQLLNPWLGS
jgi:predicted nucleic acid-binding protein